MTLTEQERKYIILLGGVAIVAALYFFAYRPLTSSVEQLQSEVSTMQAQVEQYETATETQVFYEKETVKMEEAILNMDSKLPQSLAQEKIIETMDTLAKVLDINLPIIEIGELEVIPLGEESQTDTTTPEHTGELPVLPVLQGIRSTVTTATMCSYETFKELLAYIGDYPTYISLDNIAVQGDETGLNVAFMMHFYGLEIPGREEAFLGLGPYKEGKANVFGQTTGDSTSTTAQGTGQMIYDDLFMVVDPVEADNAAITIGSANDRERQTYLYDDTNAPTKVKIHFSQTGDTYYATYQVGHQIYPQNGQRLKLSPAEGIGVKIYCTERMHEQDLNSALVEVINETDKIAYLYIRNDDVKNPRFALSSTQGDVRVINK